jgi:putative Holliday junction resolvase
MITQDPAVFFQSMSKIGRLLAYDMGTKTIGLALSDTRQMIASPLTTLVKQKSITHDWPDLQKIIEEHRIVGHVLGFPLNLNGTEGPRCQSVQQFAANLTERLDTPILLWDERLSTAAVERTMLEGDLSRKKRKQKVDQLAATYILQGLIDWKLFNIAN